MVKSTVPKIFKVVKKAADDKEWLVVRYKNIDKKQVKELKKVLNDSCKAWIQTIVPEE